MTLVQVPWQPNLMVHKDLLARLRAVEAAMGRPPMLFGPNSAWRSYAQQKALWDAYQNGTGNIASNPDTGNRTHMRGVAADLADTSLEMQRACVRAGLQRDRKENWHWQLPNWANYPIITELPEQEIYPMYSIVPYTDGRIMLESLVTGKSVHIRSTRDVGLLQRFRDNDSNDNMLPAEGAICREYIAQIAPAPGGAEIDYAKFAAELAKVVKVPTAAENAAATDAALKDDFAAVNTNINKPRTLQ